MAVGITELGVSARGQQFAHHRRLALVAGYDECRCVPGIALVD